MVIYEFAIMPIHISPLFFAAIEIENYLYNYNGFSWFLHVEEGSNQCISWVDEFKNSEQV